MVRAITQAIWLNIAMADDILSLFYQQFVVSDLSGAGVEVHNDNTISVHGSCYVRAGVHNLSVQLRHVDYFLAGGDTLAGGSALTSLKGGPMSSQGFSCRGSRITSLEYCPRRVTKGFDCAYTRITSLKGAPVRVGGFFDCSNTLLKNLEGAPKQVGLSFDCSDNRDLQDLSDCPAIIGGDFYCMSSYNLKTLRSLRGKTINGKIHLSYSKDLDLLDIPLITASGLEFTTAFNGWTTHRVETIVNKYFGTGPRGQIAMAAELVAASFDDHLGNSHNDK